MNGEAQTETGCCQREEFNKEIILWGVRWYVAYPISYRQWEEMMSERGAAI